MNEDKDKDKRGRGDGRGKACSPAKHDDCCYSMRGKDFPKKKGKFEYNIGDVKNGQQPLVSISRQVKVTCCTGYDGIANITAIEKGKHI